MSGHSRFQDTIVNKGAPILLHPRLNKDNSDYVPAGGNTGGHFNVAVGYFPESGQMKARIFEPYAFNGLLTEKLVTDRISMVKKANEANSHRNIAF